MIAVGAFRIVVLGEGATYGPTIVEPADRHRPADHRPAAVACVRGRRRRPDRHRGDRDRRAGVQAARGEERGDDPCGHGRAARDALHRDHVPRGQLRDHPDRVPEKQTVIAQVAETVYGDGIAFYLFQAFTALLLFLAANTSFNAFPRLLAILAGDGHMPRQFALRGDRLAFSYGIIALATLRAALIVYFGGSTHALIPLYAVGVFIDFTISQTGMIRHWLRERSPGYRRGWRSTPSARS
jgi:hypothetical protein